MEQTAQPTVDTAAAIAPATVETTLPVLDVKAASNESAAASPAVASSVRQAILHTIASYFYF